MLEESKGNAVEAELVLDRDFLVVHDFLNDLSKRHVLENGYGVADLAIMPKHNSVRSVDDGIKDSRHSSGHPVMEMEPIHLADLIQHCYDMHGDLIDRHMDRRAWDLVGKPPAGVPGTLGILPEKSLRLREGRLLVLELTFHQCG